LGPPKTILDIAIDFDTNELVMVGCNSLKKKIETLKYGLIHIAGHIHSNIDRQIYNHGILIRDNRTYINASISIDRSDKINSPIFFFV
jgi:Icc-related predicted phosphoesterase